MSVTRVLRSLARQPLVVLVAASLLLPAAAGAQGSQDFWITTWATALVGRPQTPPAPVLPAQPRPAPVGKSGGGPESVPAPPVPPPPPAPPPFVHFNDQTLRQVVHVSMGGSRARVVLSNAFGTAPLQIGAAAIAVREAGAALRPGTAHALTFSGRPAATIPAGAVLYSDPIEMMVPSLADLIVDVYLPGSTDTPSPLTMHGGALQTSYVSSPGNHAGAPAFEAAATSRSWFLLSRVEVAGTPGSATIVAIGDSITDGTASIPDANQRWPDRLAERLTAWNSRLGVANMGVAGNRVLSELSYAFGVNLQARFDRDVLTQPNVRHVIVMEGINDIGMARDNPLPSAEDIIAGHLQLVLRAHALGLRIHGATLTPFEGAGYYTQAGEAKRQAVNRWIRTSGAYDSVIDFDAVTRDPLQPGRLLPQYDSGDHLHPSGAGYTAMGNAIRLEVFGPPSDRR